MKAIQVTTWGGPEVMRLADVPQPRPGAGEVLVKVAAAGVNPFDWKLREGYLKEMIPIPLPFIMGNELAGTIEAVGEAVSGWQVGDRVHGSSGLSGAYAEYAVVTPGALARIPAKLNFLEAATVPAAGTSALIALETGQVGRGMRVLVHAAAGGVGSFAVQIAKTRGAEVIAATSADNISYVRSLGADQVVDRALPFENQLRDIDVVIDPFGPAAQARSWAVLKQGGILVSLVAPPSQEEAQKHNVRATLMYGGTTAALLTQIDQLIESGSIKTLPTKTYPLAQAAAALTESQQGKVRGKLVLSIPA